MEKTEMTFKIWFAQFKATFHYLDSDIISNLPNRSDLDDASWDVAAIQKDYYERGLTPLEAYDYFYNKPTK